MRVGSWAGPAGVSREGDSLVSVSVSNLNIDRAILVVNSGSSSLKFGLFDVIEGRTLSAARGEVENVGRSEGRFWVHFADGRPIDRQIDIADHVEALNLVRSAIEPPDVPGPRVLVHRIVHGGFDHRHPEVIDDEVLADLEEFVPAAPLHMAPALSLVRASRSAFPDALAVACYDTGFHASMPSSAQRYPLPASLWVDGIRRLGFHGLACEDVVDRIPDGGRMVVAHLGSGASVTAVNEGLSRDTTMSFTPTGGVMMGTRPGDLDPGLITYLLEVLGMDPAAVDEMLNHRSGLLGVSETTADLKSLLDSRHGDQRAALAVEMFVASVAKQIAAMMSVLGGCDTLVFSGGIGERSPEIRAAIVHRLAFAGLELDPEANSVGSATVSTAGSTATVRVVQVDEERVMARHGLEVFRAGRTSGNADPCS